MKTGVVLGAGCVGAEAYRRFQADQQRDGRRMEDRRAKNLSYGVSLTPATDASAEDVTPSVIVASDIREQAGSRAVDVAFFALTVFIVLVCAAGVAYGVIGGITILVSWPWSNLWNPLTGVSMFAVAGYFGWGCGHLVLDDCRALESRKGVS